MTMHYLRNNLIKVQENVAKRKARKPIIKSTKPKDRTAGSNRTSLSLVDARNKQMIYVRLIYFVLIIVTAGTLYFIL